MGCRADVRENKNRDKVVGKVFMSLGHVERMNRERFNKRVSESEVEGRRDRGRPCTMSLHRFKKACDARPLDLRDAKVMCTDVHVTGTNRRVIV